MCFWVTIFHISNCLEWLPVVDKSDPAYKIKNFMVSLVKLLYSDEVKDLRLTFNENKKGEIDYTYVFRVIGPKFIMYIPSTHCNCKVYSDEAWMRGESIMFIYCGKMNKYEPPSRYNIEWLSCENLYTGHNINYLTGWLNNDIIGKKTFMKKIRQHFFNQFPFPIDL